MINDRNLNFIISVFGNDYEIENQDKGEISFHCPFCPELGHRNDDRKLYVNTNKLAYNCFRCETHGNLSKSVSRDFDSVDIGKAFSDYLSNDVTDDEPTYYNIPKDKLVDYKDSTGYKYLKSRGFTDEDMDKYSIRLPSIDQFVGRVVVPNRIISKNWTDFYVARSYIDHPVRYKNPYSSRKSELLFNYHNIPDNPDVMILNEGPLNSIIAGDYSVASFGKALSVVQRDLIIKKNPSKLYVSYDTDALKYALKVCEDIKALSNIKVYLVELPEIITSSGESKGLDAVDLGRDKYLDIVYNTPEFINRNMFNIMKFL